MSGPCGASLSSGRSCQRETWWPGGRCSQHGYGASTIEEWVVGLAIADNLPQHLHLRVNASGLQDGIHWEIDPTDLEQPIVIDVSLSNRRNQFWRLDMSVEDAAVLADKLEERGTCETDNAYSPVHYFLPQLRRAITKAAREIVQRQGGTGAEEIAMALRNRGFHAVAADDFVVLPTSSAREIIRQLAAQEWP